MDYKEALAYISRYAPCAHENVDTSNSIWAKCDNCDAVFLKKYWDDKKQEAKTFDVAMGILAAMIRNND